LKLKLEELANKIEGNLIELGSSPVVVVVVDSALRVPLYFLYANQIKGPTARSPSRENMTGLDVAAAAGRAGELATGLAVGVLLGLAVGVLVGLAVGVLVGLAVGALVGLVVGTLPTVLIALNGVVDGVLLGAPMGLIVGGLLVTYIGAGETADKGI